MSAEHHQIINNVHDTNQINVIDLCSNAIRSCVFLTLHKTITVHYLKISGSTVHMHWIQYIFISIDYHNS